MYSKCWSIVYTAVQGWNTMKYKWDCGELFAYNEHGIFMQLFTVGWLGELLEAKICNPYWMKKASHLYFNRVLHLKESPF